MTNHKETINWLLALTLIAAYAIFGLYTDGGGTLSPYYLGVFFLIVYMLLFGADKTESLVDVTEALPISLGGKEDRDDDRRD